MVARSAQTPGFSPSARPQVVVVAGDGTLAAIQEPTRVVIVEIPSCDPFAELALDPQSSAADIAWVGTPPRLLVLARYSSHCTIHLVDPFGPRTIAEMRLEAPMKLYASVGSHALVLGSLGAGILEATDKSLSLHQFPARARPVTAGSAGSQFMVALAGAIEEWDPQSRMPKRRLKLPRPVVITAVGGSDRVVWMTTQQEPSRIEVMPLVNRGQPKAHDLPEPIASIASHPRSDLIAVVGATTGRIWVVDLDGRAGVRLIGPEGIDRVEAISLVIGRVAGVLAAQSDRPLAVEMLERDEPQTEPNQTLVTPPAEASRPHPMPVVEPGSGRSRSGPVSPPQESPPPLARQESGASPAANEFSSSGQHEFSASTHAGVPPLPDTPPAQPVATPTPVSPPVPPTPPKPSRAASTPAAPDAKDKRPRPTWPSAEETRAMVSAKASPPVVEVSRPPWARSEPPRGATSVDPLASWRERMASPRARTSEPIPALWEDALPMWREEVVAWTRGVLASASSASEVAASMPRSSSPELEAAARPDTSSDPVDAPTSTPFGAIVTRFELAPQLQPAIAFLYGAHLAGHDGVAPADLAAVLGGRWDEALGRGELAQKNAIAIERSRVRLAPAIMRALDELAPLSGTLVGAPGNNALLGPCVIVAGGALPIIAEACGSSIGGAILAGHADADPVMLVAEARAYGAAPMLRVGAHNLDRVPIDEPVILVVDDDATADGLGIPRLR